MFPVVELPSARDEHQLIDSFVEHLTPKERQIMTVLNISNVAESAAVAAFAGLTIATLRHALAIRFAPVRRRVIADRRQSAIEQRFRRN
jgi:hypothetical protein